jgi:hypothetical protein
MSRFIVGTGRCGSTLLSRMLGASPEVLSLFEFFTGLDWGRRFGTSPIDGADFADLVTAEQSFVTAVLRRGYDVEEIVYPFDRGRYRRGDPLPWLLVTMMPRLTDAPDALYDELTDFVRSRPRRTPVEHYHSLFGWLSARLGKRCWIERSGSSIEYLGGLHGLFPEARYLHLHRDGAEVALSMREHHAYRLPIALLYDAPVADGRRPSEMGAIDVACEPRDDDPISLILAARPPAEYYGRYWSDQIVRGYEGVAELAPAQYMEASFEELVREPRRRLEHIAAFFGLEPGGWLDEAAAMVRGIPPTRADKLAADERARLEEACAAGRRVIASRK